MLGENQILYRQIRQLDIPLCKEPTHSWGRPIDIGQETDEDRLTRRDNLDAIIVAKKVLPVPAGPIANVKSKFSIAST